MHQYRLYRFLLLRSTHLILEDRDRRRRRRRRLDQDRNTRWYDWYHTRTRIDVG